MGSRLILGRGRCLLLGGLCLLFIFCQSGPSAAGDNNRPAAAPPPLRLVVMDPLAEQLACKCVEGYAQRRYEVLADFIAKQLRRPVELAYAEALDSPAIAPAAGVDVVVGKYSEVLADAAQAKLRLHSTAMLTGKDGNVTQTGLFVARKDDPAKSIADLGSRRMLFGPASSQEKHAAALAALEAFGLPAPRPLVTKPSCSAAATAVLDKQADVAVISSYAMPLLEGCSTIDKGALRIVGRTDPVPFIGVFVSDRVPVENEDQILCALLAARDHPGLLTALESKEGFLRVPAMGRHARAPVRGWTDWRGPARDALSDRLPATLPQTKRLLWARTLTGPGMAGVALDAGCVVVVDKSTDEKQDIFRCLDADTGDEVWKLVYPAADKVDFTNSPRATPVIRDGLVYLLGAGGHLHCVRLATGEVVWRKHLAKDFGAKLPTWGYCSAPLVVDDKLIVNPGAPQAALVALDRLTGKVLWTTPGDPPGYACFVLAEPGGVRQIVGYDIVSLGGWDPATGRRLWKLLAKKEGDFNVPTPVVIEGKLLISTENNGTRLYGFDSRGHIIPRPLASNADLIPDSSTPVVHRGMVFGVSERLLCLDLNDGLKTLWTTDTEPFGDYCSLMAGNGFVLITSQRGLVCLVRASKTGYDRVSTLDLFKDEPATDKDTWSHPALAGNRFYVRNLLGINCVLLE